MNLLKYISLFLFVVPFSGKSQNYYPFPDSNAVWNVINCFKGDSPPFDGCGSIDRYEYRLEGDTTINGYVYNKIYYYNSPLSPTIYVGAIREDSFKRVFYHGDLQKIVFNPVTFADTAKEYLLYHFGLNVGDTVSVKANSSDSPRFIMSIDSVLINGEFRLRYEVSNPYLINSDYWIEGIGSESGLFGPYSYEFENGFALCEFQQNGNSIWTNSVTQCLTVSTEDLEFKKGLKIYPNPTTDVLYFEKQSSLKDNSIQLIKIFDLKGKLIQSTNSSTINTELFDNGMYFYSVFFNKGEIVSGKFIKE